MSEGRADFWTDETSVLFTSFWGWDPDTWGTIGYSNEDGRTHRAKRLRELSDPFITVCYVTGNKSYIDPALKGMIAGFYLVSHETGDRDEFSHPRHHAKSPEKWRHSLRAVRTFSYLPEHRISARDFYPDLLSHARAIARWGEVLTDRRQIARLRNTPWVEVDVYSAKGQVADREGEILGNGLVRAGPHNKGGYVVSPAAQELKCQLYVLRLLGATEAYLGYDCVGCSIYKIGLSVSPELRRQAFQHAMPQGAFRWVVERASQLNKAQCEFCFDAARAGEDAMKRHLAVNADHLGGEFYLASEPEIERAWELGHDAAKTFG